MKNLIAILMLALLPNFLFAENPPAPKNLDEVVMNFLSATQSVGDKIASTAGELADFARQEIPIVIQEYLNWHFTASILYFILFLSGIIGVWVVYKLIVGDEKSDDQKFVAVLATLCSAILLVAACHQLDWLKITVAPRVYLIDQFQAKMK